VKGTLEIHVESDPKIGLGNVLQRSESPDSCVVDQQVDRTDRVSDYLDRFRVSHITNGDIIGTLKVQGHHLVSVGS
jgi:hypothetical protein